MENFIELIKLINFQYIILYIILAIVSAIDFKIKIIKDEFVVAIIILAITTRIIETAEGSQLALLDGIIGFLLGGLPLLVIALISDGGVGGGDIKLLASVGMLVGKIKILEISIGVLLIASIIILAKTMFKNKSSTAFAPFIAVATVVCTAFS